MSRSRPTSDCCSICLQPLTVFVESPCFHQFHVGCLDRCFEIMDRYDCPYCRTPFPAQFVRRVSAQTAVNQTIRFMRISTDDGVVVPEDADNDKPPSEAAAAAAPPVTSRTERFRRRIATRRRIEEDWSKNVPFGSIPFGVLKCKLCSKKIHRRRLFVFGCGHCFHRTCSDKISRFNLGEQLDLMKKVKFCRCCTRPNSQDLARLHLVEVLSNE